MERWRIHSLILVALLTAGSCSGERSGTVGGEDREGADVSEVMAALEAYYDHLSARDWPAFATHFWPGADIVTTWQPPGEDSVRVVFTSIGEFIRRAPEGPGSREIFEEWMTESDVRVYGGLAQAGVRYGARFVDPGDVQGWEGIDAFTLLAPRRGLAHHVTDIRAGDRVNDVAVSVLRMD